MCCKACRDEHDTLEAELECLRGAINGYSGIGAQIEAGHISSMRTRIKDIRIEQLDTALAEAQKDSDLLKEILSCPAEKWDGRYKGYTLTASISESISPDLFERLQTVRKAMEE